MLKKILKMAIARFERQNGYDGSYTRYIVEHSPSALWKLGKIQGFATHHEDVPRDAYYAAKITSVLRADCGPCTQLVVTWAERAGVAPTTIHAVLTKDWDAMTYDVQLVVKFIEAALARSLEADVLREEIRQKWGDRAVITLAYAATAGQIYPTLKYALGFGHECTLIKVAGKDVRVSHELPKILQAI
ncbi:MAG TPA: hypothetical protein VN577_05205 [Terriglobales bacterium]|nr:hypothetical protein [Terriglobales bacterium]